MKTGLSISIIIALALLNPIPSTAQEGPARPLEISVLAKTDFFKWREYSDDTKDLLVEDLGNLWGAGLRATYSLGSHWQFYADGDYFAGNVTYKGYIINQGKAQPYTQTNGYKGWEGSAKVRYNIGLSNKLIIQPTAGMAARQWKRDLITYGQFTSLLTYNEEYFLLSPQVGLDCKYSFNARWSVSISMNLSYPLISNEKLIFNDPAGLTAAFQQAAVQNPSLQSAASYDWTHVSVDHGKNINQMGEALVRFKQYSCFIRYQKYTLGKSSNGGTDGVSIYQPNSTNDILSVGLIYALIR